LQRFIDTKLQSKLEDTTWLKDLDLELKKTRDYFKPNKYASEPAQLDNGQTVQGLSALQYKHHKANESMQQSLDDTGAGFRNRIHSNVTQYKSGPGRLYKDQELEQAARETGLEQQLREAAGTNVYPQLAARAWAQAGQGPINAVTDFARFRLDPTLRAMGQIEPNPFIPDPNTPAGRIQKYLFEDPARNALNLTRGLPAARQGDHIAEEYERRQKERN
jgi:hypothetical protein